MNLFRRAAVEFSPEGKNGCGAIQRGRFQQRLIVALAAATGWIVWKSELIRQPLTNGIAVLPFESLGEQKEQAAFADGVQDDI